MSVPVASVLAKKLRNNQGIIYVGIFFWPWNKLGQVQDPWIIPYSNKIFIAYQNTSSTRYDLLSAWYTPPNRRRTARDLVANQLPLTLYLARSRFMHGQSFLDGVHQAILGRRASLNSNELLNPKPPYFWGQHKDDQAIGVKYDFDFGFH